MTPLERIAATATSTPSLLLVSVLAAIALLFVLV
jgi:hypothetical protein